MVYTLKPSCTFSVYADDIFHTSRPTILNYLSSCATCGPKCHKGTYFLIFSLFLNTFLSATEKGVKCSCGILKRYFQYNLRTFALRTRLIRKSTCETLRRTNATGAVRAFSVMQAFAKYFQRRVGRVTCKVFSFVFQ